MTRKDYIKLADSFVNCKPSINHEYYGLLLAQWRACIQSIAYVLQADNSNFDRNRFFDACGYED